MSEEILAFVRAMGGGGEPAALEHLCQAAEQELAGQLKQGLSPADCGPAFPVAAAWLVLAGLEAGNAGVSAFSAGDLTIRTDANGSDAIARQVRRLMAPYLADHFAFLGAPG